MKINELLQTLLDPENQPHQYVGFNKRDFKILLLRAIEELAVEGLNPEYDYDEFVRCIEHLIWLQKDYKKEENQND